MTIPLGFFFLLQQTEQAHTGSLAELLLRASPIAKIVLVLLLAFSVWSWSIIFSKLAAFRKAERATRDFLQRFGNRSRLSDVYTDAEANRESPVARVFLSSYDEITGHLAGARIEPRGLDSIQRALQSAAIDEVTQMERNLSWLATTANSSPFIGLFGTVVGIVIAFQSLTTATSSSIQSVAPGIAEALVATAAGIGAAVPAAIFYNVFVNRIKHMTSTMDRFSLETLNLIERSYVKTSA